MTSIWLTIFPSLRPAGTVENFGVRMTDLAVPGVGDDTELEAKMSRLLDAEEES